MDKGIDERSSLDTIGHNQVAQREMARWSFVKRGCKKGVKFERLTSMKSLSVTVVTCIGSNS